MGVVEGVSEGGVLLAEVPHAHGVAGGGVEEGGGGVEGHLADLVLTWGDPRRPQGRTPVPRAHLAGRPGHTQITHLTLTA